MANEPHVIRMKVPENEIVKFYDLVRDEVAFNTAEIDDQVLVKTDGFPTYHLANVIDDHHMGMTHVIRGEEWLPSTPKHVLLYKFFGWKPPKFAHLPLLLNPDRSKLSKRQGDVAVEDYLKKGYLPEALVNFVALLGWGPGNDREIFSLQELEKAFSLKGLQKAGAVFDVEKLKWMNGQYIRELKLEEIADRAKPFFTDAGIDIDDNEKYLLVIEDARKRISTLGEVLDFAAMFYQMPEVPDEFKSIPDEEDSQKVFRFWADQLEQMTAPDQQEIKELIQRTAQEISIKGKSLYWPIRLALYGSPHGPDIPALVSILGLDESVSRLRFFTK